jgi:hypothetical protein
LDKLKIDRDVRTDDGGNPYIADTQLVVIDGTVIDSEFVKISDSINNYLAKNKGAVSDFMLIKDIVERNCDSLEEEISTQTPIPLYIGLMGTMSGIILGLGKIALVDGFSTFIQNPQQSIGELMGGVAIAMIASLCGIILSTLSAWYAKQSKSILESKKNAFYSWIQAKLLPVLHGNITSTLHVLQSNFKTFNNSFSSNIASMKNALEQRNNVYNMQLKILDQLNKLDVQKIATANVTVLQQLELSTSRFKEFSDYLAQTTAYLNAVRDLNTRVGEYMQHSAALTHLAEYFESENNYFKERSGMLNKGVVDFDQMLQKSFSTLQENSKTNFDAFNYFVIRKQEEIKSYLTESEKIMEEKVGELNSSMTSHITEQVHLLEAKLGELNTLADAMKNFTSVKDSLAGLVDALERKSSDSYEVVASVDKLGKKLDILCQVVKDSGNSGWQDADDETKDVSLAIFNKPYMSTLLYVFVVVLFLASLGVIFIAGHLIVDLIK